MQQLVPGTEDASAQPGLFLLEGMKASWRPAMHHLRAQSYPTPFAQAELMAHVLSLLELTPGVRQPRPEAENPELSQTFERWRLLVLGSTLGLLELEVVDLGAPEARRFGAMLHRLRPQAPELSLVRLVAERGVEGRALVIGGTDPACLVWASPRNAIVWQELRRRIDGHPQVQEALRLLADWRVALQGRGWWRPELVGAPPWMRALEVLLAGVKDGGGRVLAEDSRAGAAVRLALPRLTGASPEFAMVYLPVLDPGFHARARELLFFEPTVLADRPGVVGLRDGTGRVVGSVRTAPAGRGAVPELLEGVGSYQFDDAAPRLQGSALWVEDRGNVPGLRTLVGEAILAAAARTHGRVRLNWDDVQEFPIGFPSLARVLARVVLGAGQGIPVQLSRVAVAKLRAGEHAPMAAPALEAWNPGDSLPGIVPVPGGLVGPSPALVERVEGASGVVDVGELRALGFGLWLVFLGEAAPREAGDVVVWLAEDEQELFGRTVLEGRAVPLGVHREALTRVFHDATRDRVRARLATLQRFTRTYKLFLERHAADAPGARLAMLAVEALVQWTAEPSLQLARFGAAAAAPWKSLDLGNGARLPLFRDPWLSTEGSPQPPLRAGSE